MSPTSAPLRPIGTNGAIAALAPSVRRKLRRAKSIRRGCISILPPGDPAKAHAVALGERDDELLQVAFALGEAIAQTLIRAGVLILLEAAEAEAHPLVHDAGLHHLGHRELVRQLERAVELAVDVGAHD